MKDHHPTDIIDLFDALLFLKDSDEMKNFFKDLCTPQEVAALKERWRVCQLLETEDLSYRDIHRVTGASLTTIGRVARFLREESYQGYRTLLERVKKRKLK